MAVYGCVCIRNRFYLCNAKARWELKEKAERLGIKISEALREALEEVKCRELEEFSRRLNGIAMFSRK